MNSLFPSINAVTNKSAFSSVVSHANSDQQSAPNNETAKGPDCGLQFAAALASIQAQLNLAALMQSWTQTSANLGNLGQSKHNLDPKFLPPFPSLDMLRNALNSPQKNNTNISEMPNNHHHLSSSPSTTNSQSSSSAPSSPPHPFLKKAQNDLECSPVSQRKQSNPSSASKRRLSKSEQKTSATSGPSGASSNVNSGSPSKRSRGVRRLNLTVDHVTNSPVSGMHIMAECDMPPIGPSTKAIEMDDTAKYVDISEESRAALSRIPNVIGDYVCRLCKVTFLDAFRLAQHRCPRIVHEEYRCPECDKVFSCPANLASHRRWHKPKNTTTVIQVPVSDQSAISSPYNEPENQDQPLNLMVQGKRTVKVNNENEPSD